MWYISLKMSIELDEYAHPIPGLIVMAVDSEKYGLPPVEIFQHPSQGLLSQMPDIRWSVFSRRLCEFIRSQSGDFKKGYAEYIHRLERNLNNDEREIANGNKDEDYFRIVLRREIYEDCQADPSAERFRTWMNANLGNPFSQGREKLVKINHIVAYVN